MTDTWPIDILSPRQITRHVAPRTTAGTVAVSGFTQRVSVPAHAWIIEYAGITVGTAAQLREWDRVAAALDGGAESLFVPLVGEEQDATQGVIDGNWAAGATTINMRRAVVILAGYHFSIGGRLYRVARVVSITDDNHTLEIRPPLRDALFHDQQASFAVLLCKCRLATDDEMRLTLDPARIGVGNIRWFEDPN